MVDTCVLDLASFGSGLRSDLRYQGPIRIAVRRWRSQCNRNVARSEDQAGEARLRTLRRRGHRMRRRRRRRLCLVRPRGRRQERLSRGRDDRHGAQPVGDRTRHASERVPSPVPRWLGGRFLAVAQREWDLARNLSENPSQAGSLRHETGFSDRLEVLQDRGLLRNPLGDFHRPAAVRGRQLRSPAVANALDEILVLLTVPPLPRTMGLQVPLGYPRTLRVQRQRLVRRRLDDSGRTAHDFQRRGRCGPGHRSAVLQASHGAAREFQARAAIVAQRASETLQRRVIHRSMSRRDLAVQQPAKQVDGPDRERVQRAAALFHCATSRTRAATASPGRTRE